jgi:hypothetical protein
MRDTLVHMGRRNNRSSGSNSGRHHSLSSVLIRLTVRVQKGEVNNSRTLLITHVVVVARL